ALTIIGVDDWAWKKGQRYGTLIVDLTTHCPVAVLPDRTAETLATWLRQHPSIQVISRDRGGPYAKGAREGAPQAQQVADRFHLLRNWGDRVASIIGAWHPPAGIPQDPREMPERPDAVATPTVSPRKRQRWEAVHRLNAHGWSVSAIADHLHCDRETVRKDLAADQPRPPRSPGLRSPSAEDHVLSILWQGDRHMTAQALWEAASQQGYTKSVGTVSRWLRRRRGRVNRGRRAATRHPDPRTPLQYRKPWTPRQWAHWLSTGWRRIPRHATGTLSARIHEDPTYRLAWTLT
ncbi:transposase, partial [Sulfobacillus harzensis]